MRHLPLALAALMSLAACAVAVDPEPPPVVEVNRKSGNPGPAATKRPTGETPYALEWKQNLPAMISVTLTETAQADHGSTETTYAFSYTPDPPDVLVELAAAPGTPPFELTAVDLTWRYSQEGETQKVGPSRLPIAPVQVTGAPADMAGIPFRVTVPLNVGFLKPLFTDPDRTKRIAEASAVLSFYASGDKAVFAGGTAVPLTVPVRIVAE